MQRWEEKQKQKAHESIVENAKSTLKRYSNSREKVLGSSRSKVTTSKRQLMPINKILEIFQLEQYGWLLLAHGFPHKMAQKNSLDYIEEMLDEVGEEDKERFLSLLNTLTIMSRDIKRPIRTPKQTTNSRKVIYPPPYSNSTQSKQTPTSLQKSEKTTSKFRIKNKQSVHLHIPHQGYEKRPPKIMREHSIPEKKKRRKSVTHSKIAARDDLSLVHDFRSHDSGQICAVQDNNRILQRLLEKLEHHIQPVSNTGSSEQIKLEMEKIKEMYLSYDSATLSSNITNIDLQQMIDCLSMEVSHLVQESEIHCLAKNNEERIKSLLHESFVMVREQSKDSRTQNQDAKGEGEEEGEAESEEQIVIVNKAPFKKGKGSCESSSSDACSIGELENDKSSIWGNSYIGSVISDFSCFDNQFKGSTFRVKPELQDIKNFVGLVIMAGKMEKQVPIICYVYLKRLLKIAPNSKVTSANWRNLLLVTLIEASKIWDDQSLENHSFATVIKPYTTLEINRLEKYLLFFLDYHLNVNQKEYSAAYFGLRKHAGVTSHTANLMRLDLRTIKKLQGSGEKEVKKKQFFKKCMNKSF